MRVSTQKRHRALFDKFLEFSRVNGVHTWNAVTRQSLEGYATHLDGRSYAAKTLRHELTIIVQAFKWFVREKHLQGMEPLSLQLKKVEGERAYCYTAELVGAMVELCRENQNLKWLGEILTALACTGLRISELAALRWSDVDRRNGQLVLTDESAHFQKSGRARRSLKSGRSRSLPIHADLATVFARLEHRDGYVFHGPRGARLKADTIRRIFVRDVITKLSERFPSLADEQGFKDGRFHGFRHHFASMCAMNGDSERVAMAWLRHQDSAMVRHYFHLNDRESRPQLSRLAPIEKTGSELAGNFNAAQSSHGAAAAENSENSRQKAN